MNKENKEFRPNKRRKLEDNDSEENYGSNSDDCSDSDVENGTDFVTETLSNYIVKYSSYSTA